MMDPTVPKDALYFVSEFWSTLVVALVIYIGGVIANSVVTTIWPQTTDLVSGKTKVMSNDLPRLFRVWYITRLAHPFLVGAAISFIPDIPHPMFVTSRTSAALWFGLAGISNGQIHMLVDAAVGQVRKTIGLLTPWVRQKIGAPPSLPPPPSERTTEPAPEPDETKKETS